MPTHTSRVLGAIALVLTGVPFAVEAIRSAAISGYIYQGGDQALIELATRRAVSFHQLVGPYDRFGWDHPGPSYFYLLSLPYRIFGPGARPELVGEVLIFGVAALAVVAVLWRKAGGAAAAWSAIWILLACIMLTPLRVEYPWNPLAVVVPMVLVVVLSAAAMAGSALWLLLAAVAGSFAVQTDVSTLPLTAVVLVLGAACLAARRITRSRRQPLATSGPEPGAALRNRVLAGIAIVVLVAMWIPPLVQELNGPGPGNLGTILHFFTHSTVPHVPFSIAANDVAAVDSLLALGAGAVLGQSIPSPHTAAVLTVVILIGLAAVGLGWRRRQPFAVSLGALSLIGLLASIVAVTRIVGGVMGYLILWEIAAPLVGLSGLGVAILAPARQATVTQVTQHGRGFQRVRGACVAGVTGLAGLGVAAACAVMLNQVSGMASPPTDLYGAQVALAWRLADHHVGRPPGTVLVNMLGSPQYAVGAGLVDRLAALGFRPRVPAVWSVQFGLSQVIRSHPQSTIVLGSPSSPAPAGFVLAGEADASTAVFVALPSSGPRPPSLTVRRVRRARPLFAYRVIGRHLRQRPGAELEADSVSPQASQLRRPSPAETRIPM